jgi:lipopolysaccharide transport system permease protein
VIEPVHTAPWSGNSVAGTVSTASAKPSVVIEPTRSAFDLDLRSVYRSWELIYFLAWRDVIVRYKQTIIGIGWAVLQPLVTMLIFTALFSRLAQIPSDGVPYSIFAFTALVPWLYFAQAVGRGGTSLVNNASLVTKVYFPRLAIPIAAVISPLVDFAVAFALLLVMMVWYGIQPGWNVLALPLLLVWCVTAALAVTVWLSALSVKYRDVGVVIPFLLQVWLYASPVAYPVSSVPAAWRPIYSLNPMVGVIEGFRWSLLRTASPDFTAIGVSAVVVVVLLAGGIVYFKQSEQVLADIV